MFPGLERSAFARSSMPMQRRKISSMESSASSRRTGGRGNGRQQPARRDAGPARRALPAIDRLGRSGRAATGSAVSQMEAWTFPPSYDEAYLPEPGSRYWFPVRETMEAGERERAIIARLRDVMRYAYGSSPFYRHKWNEAGIDVEAIDSLEAFERVP